jgi:hypothetical protein
MQETQYTQTSSQGICRVALASNILLAIVYFKGDKIPSSPGLWSAFLIMGALNNLIPLS